MYSAKKASEIRLLQMSEEGGSYPPTPRGEGHFRWKMADNDSSHYEVRVKKKGR